MLEQERTSQNDRFGAGEKIGHDDSSDSNVHRYFTVHRA
jgi:hypothetical protein